MYAPHLFAWMPVRAMASLAAAA